MNLIVDYLSYKAKEHLTQYKDCNLGVISVHSEDSLKSEKNFALLFRRSSKYGRYYIREYDEYKNLIMTSLLLNNDNKDDSGNLLGFLVKQTNEFDSKSFLFKSNSSENFIEIDNPKFPFIKYKLAERNYLRLESVRSNLSRFTNYW